MLLHLKPARHKLDDSYWQQIDPDSLSLPVSERICQDQAVCLHHLVLMADRTVMEQFAAAVEKIRKNAGELLTQQELASK